jgi:phospho-2-dehydro-3-deoxyheptonate aldolase
VAKTPVQEIHLFDDDPLPAAQHLPLPRRRIVGRSQTADEESRLLASTTGCGRRDICCWISLSPQYIASLVSWGAIGACTTESQVHRQLSSGLSCPVGFMNGTSGNVQIAIEAMVSAAHPQTFLGHSKTGQSAILFIAGNPDCHIILRGSRQTTNYNAAAVAQTAEQMEKAGVARRVS